MAVGGSLKSDFSGLHSDTFTKAVVRLLKGWTLTIPQLPEGVHNDFRFLSPLLAGFPAGQVAFEDW
jgi:hypothetical protein